jgi:hypothetical protein
MDKQFSERFNFLIELQKALSIYFSDPDQSKYIGIFGQPEIYDWKIAFLVVRCYFNEPPTNRVLIVSKEEIVARMYHSKKIIDTQFYQLLLEIPKEHEHSIAHFHKGNLTPGMREHLLSRLKITEPTDSGLTIDKLSSTLNEKQKWSIVPYKTQISIELTPS